MNTYEREKELRRIDMRQKGTDNRPGNRFGIRCLKTISLLDRRSLSILFYAPTFSSHLSFLFSMASSLPISFSSDFLSIFLLYFQLISLHFPSRSVPMFRCYGEISAATVLDFSVSQSLLRMMGTNKMDIRYIQYYSINMSGRESKMTIMDEMKDKSTLCTIVFVFIDNARFG